MNSVYDTLRSWARRTALVEPEVGEGLAYRLKHWPELPTAHKTANVYRVLSVMSSRPVNRHWMLVHAGVRPAQLDRLLRRLVDEDAVEVIDVSGFTGNA